MQSSTSQFMRRRKLAIPCVFFFVALTVLAHGDDRQTSVGKSATQIGDRIALFVPEGYNPARTPSLAFASPPKSVGPVVQDWRLTPTFTFNSGKAGASLAVPEGSSLYGTGEVTGPLLRNGHSVSLWNTDNFGYHKHDGKQLYQSHPWVLGVRPDGTAFGVLFDTTWKSELRTNSDRIELNSEGAPFRVAVIDRESPQAVLHGLAELIGTMPLPPKWALGFHQCRYSYYPDARVREIADEFRARHLPCDVIWMDIHYMDGFRIFTFDKNRFPDPKATNDYLHSKQFHSVWMIDPGVKADPDYSVYKSGSAEHLWVQTKGGSDFHGKVWPGVCVFPDFTMPATQQWWGSLYKDFLAKGVDGVWNDMNEPAVFDGPDASMPEDNQHRGGGDLPAGSHLMYHNVYGALMVKASRDGILAARPEKRPFVLSRSNYLGGQRSAATWTGDNEAEMSFLTQSIPMSINLGLSGQPLSGPDIGGYNGKGSPELYANWIAVGAFYPFSRAHASVDSPNREPWVFGSKIEDVARTALERRYRLMPYLYTLAQNASTTGEPMMAPVFFADPKDPELRSEDRAFLFGPNLLIIPHWASNPKLPKGIWRDVSLLDGNREQDGYQPELKLRGGAIVPLGAVVQSTAEASLAPLTLLVCLDDKGQAQRTLYDDAGDGFEYRKGSYSLMHFTATKEGNAVKIREDSHSGEMDSKLGEVNVELLNAGNVIKGHGNLADGIAVTVSQ